MWDNHSLPRAWTPAALRDMSVAFQASRILLTAVELRLFSIIGGEAVTSGDVADRAGTDAHGTDRLLNALSTVHLVLKRNGRFRNTPEGLRYLVDSSPEYAAGLRHSASMWHAWSGLTERVRNGQQPSRAAVNDRGDEWLDPFIAAMHYRARLQADPIAALLPLTESTRVLDVGGGSGAFSVAMARRTHGLRAVVFDLPNVMPLTQRYVADAGLGDFVTTAVGDYLTDPLPTGFDLVFLSAVVHSNSAEQNARLIAKCVGALNPGGSVAVVDWVMDADRVKPEAGALFAINMLVGTDSGDTFTEDEIRSWMIDSGLEQIHRRATPFGTDVMIGKRVAVPIGGTLHFCTQCGQQVDPYEPSPVEPGNPAGDRTFFCRSCGQEWPAPNMYATGQPCGNCGMLVPTGARHCAACGHQTWA